MAGRPSSRQQLHGRQSVAVGSLSRQSMAPGAVANINQAPTSIQYDENGEIMLSPAQQRVLDKQSEWDGFLRLVRQTEVQQQYMSELGEKTALMGDGTAGEHFFVSLGDGHVLTQSFAIVVAKVTSNWQNVFRATHLALCEFAYTVLLF